MWLRNIMQGFSQHVFRLYHHVYFASSIKHKINIFFCSYTGFPCSNGGSFSIWVSHSIQVHQPIGCHCTVSVKNKHKLHTIWAEGFSALAHWRIGVYFHNFTHRWRRNSGGKLWSQSRMYRTKRVREGLCLFVCDCVYVALCASSVSGCREQHTEKVWFHNFTHLRRYGRHLTVFYMCSSTSVIRTCNVMMKGYVLVSECIRVHML